MFKFFYRSRKPAKHQGGPPQACLDDLRTWIVTGNPTILQKAINSGLDVSRAVDDKLGSALHVAAQRLYLESLFVLHATGIKDVTRNPQDELAVHLAAATGFRDGVLYIIKNMGADIDAHTKEGATPLMLAIENDHSDVASALLARGARVARPSSFKAGEGQKSGDERHVAIHLCKSPEMLRLLLTTTTLHVDTRSQEGNTLLHVCSARGDTATAAECLALGANCQALDHKQSNALHYACRNRAAHIIPLLIKAGCSSSEADAEGLTPVEVALLAHDCDTAYALYCAGALFTKRQLLLLSVLLRHSSLLKAIRSERQLCGMANDSTNPDTGTQSSLEEAAAKVENQAAVLLAGPDELHEEGARGSSFSLASVVVSVGKVPVGADVTAENFHSMFQNLHDPVPRPVGTDTSAVLVSVFSRFLRHSDSSLGGASMQWRAGHAGRVRGAEGPAAVVGVAGKADTPSPLQHRHSESILDAPATKKALWPAAAGHPPRGPPFPVGGQTEPHPNAVDPHSERQEAAAKLDGPSSSAAGRSSLERLLPHYLRGLSHFVNQNRAPPVASTPQGRRQGTTNTHTVLPSAPTPTPAQHSTAHDASHIAIARGSAATDPASRPLSISALPAANAVPVAPNKAAGTPGWQPQHAAGAAQHAEQPARQAVPRRSFCGDLPPEGSAPLSAMDSSANRNVQGLSDEEQLMQDHRSRNIRKSAFFSRGRVQANEPHVPGRRSQTFDWGYRHSEAVGVPAARGRWGEPQALPGPGGALGNPNTRSDPSQASQDDMVLMREHTALPQYGQDLAGDGMMEFEEMMARRVRLFDGERRRAAEPRHIHQRPISTSPGLIQSQQQATGT